MQEYEQDSTASDSDDTQKITQVEQRAIRKNKVKTPPSFTQSSSSTISKAPSFHFRMPVSKLNILRQSLQKQNLITVQTTCLKTSSTTTLTIPSDSRERPKVQAPVWIAESKVTEVKAIRKFNSKTKQTVLAGKFSHNSFDNNTELTDSFENLKDKEFEFTSQEKYISVKGKLKQNQSFWEILSRQMTQF